MNLHIRPEATTDIAAIDAVIVAAFLHAPHTSHKEQYIVRALRAADALAISLVAELQGRVVGHVAVSAVVISDDSLGWFGLGPIAVSPEIQRQGIGVQLMRQALHLLEMRGAAGCVVLGDPGYYRRFGFKAQPTLTLPGVPAEYFQVLSLGAPLPTGTVTYHVAFDANG